MGMRNTSYGRQGGHADPGTALFDKLHRGARSSRQDVVGSPFRKKELIDGGIAKEENQFCLQDTGC